MSGFRAFNPDLIVEVTGVCDRACAGCYAPNLISKFSPEDLFLAKPEMFLTAAKLSATLAEIESSLELISIRGGEPSRHPYLSDLLGVAHEHARTVFVETHGRWVLSKSDTAEALIQACARLGTILKISFDRMHGLSGDDLKAITVRLTKERVEWMIAITEADEKDFLKTRALCDWLPNEKIIYQRKALSSQELVEPRIGVIKIGGSLARTLTAKQDFIPNLVFAELAT